METHHQMELAPSEVIEEKALFCTVCQEGTTITCVRCQSPLCLAHSYREEGGSRSHCRACADEIVGVCDICDALHARACHECGQKVCQDHAKRVVERWGWGGLAGQGGVTNWFPILRTYCQEHGRQHFSLPKPSLKTFRGYDGSSPEW